MLRATQRRTCGRSHEVSGLVVGGERQGRARASNAQIEPRGAGGASPARAPAPPRAGLYALARCSLPARAHRITEIPRAQSKPSRLDEPWAGSWSGRKRGRASASCVTEGETGFLFARGDEADLDGTLHRAARDDASAPKRGGRLARREGDPEPLPQGDVARYRELVTRRPSGYARARGGRRPERTGELPVLQSDYHRGCEPPRDLIGVSEGRLRIARPSAAT